MPQFTPPPLSSLKPEAFTPPPVSALVPNDQPTGTRGGGNPRGTPAELAARRKAAITGVIDSYPGFVQMGEGSRQILQPGQRKEGLHNLIEGVGKFAAVPMLPLAAVAAPIPTALGVVGGTVGGVAGKTTAKMMGAEDDTAALVGDVSGIAAGTLAARAGVSVKNAAYALKAIVENPKMQEATIKALPKGPQIWEALKLFRELSGQNTAPATPVPPVVAPAPVAPPPQGAHPLEVPRHPLEVNRMRPAPQVEPPLRPSPVVSAQSAVDQLLAARPDFRGAAATPHAGAPAPVAAPPSSPASVAAQAVMDAKQPEIVPLSPTPRSRGELGAGSGQQTLGFDPKAFAGGAREAKMVNLMDALQSAGLDSTSVRSMLQKLKATGEKTTPELQLLAEKATQLKVQEMMQQKGINYAAAEAMVKPVKTPSVDTLKLLFEEATRREAWMKGKK